MNYIIYLLITLAIAVLIMFILLLKYKRHRTASISDYMLPCYNRRMCDIILKKEIYSAVRLKKHIAVCLIDVDNLKLLNEKYSYKQTNKLLIQMVNLLQANLRREDFFFRYQNGDEFLAIFKTAKEKHITKKIAEKLRKSVSENIFVLHDKPASMSISIGAIDFFPYDNTILSSDMEQYVDNYLDVIEHNLEYILKKTKVRKGKNCVLYESHTPVNYWS